jgi:hypothetical protein
MPVVVVINQATDRPLYGNVVQVVRTTRIPAGGGKSVLPQHVICVSTDYNKLVLFVLQ